MPWALLWKFRKYIGIALAIIALFGFLDHAMTKHDHNVAAKAVHTERLKELNVESDYVNSLIRDHNETVDSLVAVNEQEKQKRATVQEHTKKLAALQTEGQANIDAFIAIKRSDEVKEIVDSLTTDYSIVVARLKDQLVDAGILYHSLELENKRNLAVIELKNSQLEALKSFNLNLHRELNDGPPVIEDKGGESVGHFIVHKIVPVGFVVLGTLKLSGKI